jgi:autotransporter-associated beta strand protein
VKVAGSGTTELADARALGVGQLRQTNGNSTVRLNFAGTMSNAISVYKVAFATNGATLAGTTTVNNAEFDVAGGDTNTITGQITGSGGVTKTGGGRLVLAGTATNDFTEASAVNAGTLLLNKTAGTTAISGSTIAVNSGGTLLLGAANQISDTTLVTLAGGTLDTGGFGDAVGKLTVTAASTIKGLAAAGGGSDFTFSDIDLGNYTTASGSSLTLLPTSGTYSLGTVIQLSSLAASLWTGYGDGTALNNFSQKVSFSDANLRAQINFGGGISGTTLTVAAIPEPRVYAAAAVLTILIGFAEYRRRRRIEDRS